MHSRLESYLSEVDVHLSALPAKRRNEELREIRQHLLNAVTVNRELGQSDEDAVQNAVMHFGMPKDLSENLVWAWRRERKLDGRDFWGAAVCVPLLCWMTIFAPDHFIPSPSRSFAQPPFSGFLWVEWILWIMPHFVLIGGLSGLLFPKRALAGVTLGVTGYLAWYMIAFDLGLTAGYRNIAYYVMDIIIIGTTAFAAKAGSRWQIRRTARKRLAQG